MKVFISADIEGVTGLTVWEDARANGSLYPELVQQMGKEVAAACRGAKNAGAKEVIVKDSHGSGRNIDQNCLPKYAKLIRGWTGSPLAMVGGLDNTFDALLFIGYHDAAGSPGNPTAHTMNSSKISYLKFNGTLAGEFHIHSYAAAYLGVPTVFISGDEEVCKKAKEISKNIVTVATKKGLGSSTISINPILAEEQIEEKAAAALNRDLEGYTIILPEYFDVELAYKQHFDAYRNSFYPGAQQISANTIKFKSNDYYEVLRFLSFVI